MKSVMLMMVVALMASFSSAVSINWKGTNTSSSWLNNLTQCAVVYSATETDISLAGAAAMAGVSSSDGKYIVDKGTTGARNEGELRGGLSVNTTSDGGVDIGVVHNTGTYFVVLFDTTKKEYAVLTLDAKDLEFRDQTIRMYEGEFYGTAVVPEPTILALLALGIAGVALRRRAQ